MVDWFAKERLGERCESFFFLHKFLESPFLDPSSCFLINCAFPSYLSLLLYSLPLASRTRVDSIKDQTSLSSASLPSSSNSSRHFRHMTLLCTISGRMLFEPYTYLQSRAYVYSRAILAFSYCFFFSSGLPLDLQRYSLQRRWRLKIQERKDQQIIRPLLRQLLVLPLHHRMRK